MSQKSTYRYGVYDKGIYQCSMSPGEIELEFGIRRGEIVNYANQKILFDGRWLFVIEKVFEEAWQIRFDREWEKWRERFLGIRKAV